MSSVYLHVYDLSRGLAAQASIRLLGRKIEGIWHTGIVVYNKEWYFGNYGVIATRPKKTILGEPCKIIDLGSTEKTELEVIQEIHYQGKTSFRFQQRPVNKNIPVHITDMPNDILNSSFGALLTALLKTPKKPS